MSKFLTPLRVEKVTDSDDLWMLLEDLVYQSDIGGLIRVPAKFITDFATVPQIFWTLFPKDGKWDGPAAVHDFLYSMKIFPRVIADAIFREALKASNIGFFTRWTMWTGVRLGGWIKIK